MKINKYVLIGLVIAVLVGVYTAFFTGGKKAMVSSAAPLEPPKAVPQPVDTRARDARVQSVQDAMQWERDPFMLPATVVTEKKQAAEKQRVPLKLVAIMESAKGRVAIIDNEVVVKGDTVAGERVLEIGRDTVTLIQEGSKRVISIQEPR